MKARELQSSARRRSRRTTRTWMTEAEAAVALTADPTWLSVEHHVALSTRIELRADGLSRE